MYIIYTNGLYVLYACITHIHNILMTCYFRENSITYNLYMLFKAQTRTKAI